VSASKSGKSVLAVILLVLGAAAMSVPAAGARSDSRPQHADKNEILTCQEKI